MTTFCWLPPDSAETGASSDGALTDSDCSELAATCATSRPRLSRDPLGKRLQRRDGRVLAHGQAHHQALGVPVRGHVRGPVQQIAGERQRRPPTATVPVNGSSPASARSSSLWPLPTTPASADDLARAAADAETPVKPGPERSSTTKLASSLARRRVLGREGRVELAADDQGQQLVVGDVADPGGAAHPAVAEDGDPVGELADLGQPVGDVDDRGAGRDAARAPGGRTARRRRRRAVRWARRG